MGTAPDGHTGSPSQPAEQCLVQIQAVSERKGVISEIFYQENVGFGGDGFDNGDGRDGDVHRPGRCGGNPASQFDYPAAIK
jgi:hypothetical protein